jgi:ribosomal-protein-alanine N-acetyltransferase
MKETLEKIIDYAFNTIKVLKIDALVHRDNQSSIKLLDKLSFGNTNEHDDSNHNLIYYRLTNS